MESKVTLRDEEIFHSLLERNNIVFSVEIRGEDKVYIIESMHEGANQGYSGFFAEWTFDRTGKLRMHGVWE